MKVLLVNGSPHQTGTTNRALEEMVEIFHQEGIDTEIHWIGSGAVSGCRACGACGKIGHCVIDDQVNEFNRKAAEADGFIFASPVYYASSNASMNAFMDRIFFSALCSHSNIYYLKPAASVSTARRAGTITTIDQMNKYYQLMEMPIISSSYWNEYHGHFGDTEDEEGLQTLRTLARNMTWFLRIKEAGKDVPLPQKEEKHMQTNFMR